MPERQSEFETFGDSQVQALFDKFLITPEPVLRTSDLLTQRVLAEVQLVYGRGTQPLVPGTKWLRQLAEWAASFRPRAVVIAFSSVAVAALLVLSVALYTLIPVPVSIAATVPTGEILVLKPSDDSYQMYRAGDSFSLSEGDQIIARTGSVQIELFPQQFTDVMPGAQVELAVLEDQNGARRAELHVIDGSVRHRGFESLAAGDQYFVSTAGLIAEFASNDFEVDAVSPTHAIVTTRDGTARIKAASGDKELTAGQAAEVGERFVLIYDIAPIQEGPGEIALADPSTAAIEEPVGDDGLHAPATDELPGSAPFTLTAQPVVPTDRGDAVTGTSGGYITSTEADSGSVLTVSRVTFDETQAEPVLMLSGYGPMGSSVQVLVENRPMVTATVSAEGTWMAQTPVNTIGRFDVDVVAVNDAGQIVASANAAQMEVGPPVKAPTPTPAEQSGIIVPPPGATATWTPNSNSGSNAAPTKTPTRRPTSTATATAKPIVFLAPVLPPTATSVPTVPKPPKATATPTNSGGPFIVIVPSPTPSDTPTSTGTARATPTSSATPLPSPSATSSPTSSATPLPSATATSTASATRLPTETATTTATAPATSTGTSTATATNTPAATGTSTATALPATATATQPPAVPTTGVNVPPVGDTPVPTLSVFPTATPTPVPQATVNTPPTATPTPWSPTATSTPVVPTATPGSTLNDTGVNQSVPNDTATDTSTLPVPTIVAPTASIPTATPTQVPPTPTAVVVTQPTATATQPPALPNSAVGDTSTSDAPPPAPATPAPTATQAPPPTAVPTVAAAPASVVNQPVGDTSTSNNSVPATADTTVPTVAEVATPAATVESAPTAEPSPAATEPPATEQPVDSLPVPVDPAATPTG